MLGLSVDNGWTNLMQVPCHGGSAMLQLWVVLYNKLDVGLLSPEVQTQLQLLLNLWDKLSEQLP